MPNPMIIVDVYDRYQDINDPVAFANATDAAYIKATDGAGPAIMRADNFVRIMRETSTPFGLYHYAQLSPTPEAQARVLVNEARRLGLAGMGLPLALDLEDPFRPDAQARNFAYRFLMELRSLGFADTVLYANTSMLTGIRAWDLGVPGLRIWAATYGNNDADFDADDTARLQRQYPHPVWLFQHSSTGRIPGIPGNVDLNRFMVMTNGVDELSWNEPLTFTNPDTGAVTTYPAKDYEMWTNHYANMIPSLVAANSRQEAMLTEILKLVSDDDLDSEAVMARLSQVVKETTEASIRDNVMPVLQQTASSILVGETSQELVDRFTTEVGQRLTAITAPPATA